MGSKALTSVITLVALLTLIDTCRSYTPLSEDCPPADELVGRFKQLRVTDWRDVVASDVRASWHLTATAQDATILHRCGKWSGDKCLCDQKAVLDRNQPNRLRAVEITQWFPARESALTAVAALVVAATGKPMPQTNTLRDSDSYSQASFGWTEDGLDTLLDGSVQKDGDGW